MIESCYCLILLKAKGVNTDSDNGDTADNYGLELSRRCFLRVTKVWRPT